MCKYHFKKIATIEVHSTEPSHKNRKCPYLGNRLTDLNQTFRVDGYFIKKYYSKKSD